MDSHATTVQLAAYLGTSAPADATRLLARASELFDYYTHSMYDTDSGTGLATDTDLATALANATCAVVEAWIEVGEHNDLDGLASMQVSVGGHSGYRAPPMPPRAHRYLANAGLLQPGGVAPTEDGFV